MRLRFAIDTHQNVNQKPIGSAPAYQVQCTLPYHTLLFDFSRVWFWDYRAVERTQLPSVLSLAVRKRSKLAALTV